MKPVEADRQIREVPLKKNDPLNLPKFEEPKNFDVKKVAAEIKSFGFAGLKEEKHIEAVPLDREGKINPEFHREIFLGNHENFETQIQNNEKKRKEKLTEIFHKFEENCWFFVSDLENVLELTSISRILCRKTNCSILFTKTFRSIYKRPKTKTVNCSS